MNVGMDEVERLLKRYVSTGAAVVVVILGPGQADPPADRPAATTQVTTGTVTPIPTTTPERAAVPDPAAVPRTATGRASAAPPITATTTPSPTTTTRSPRTRERPRTPSNDRTHATGTVKPDDTTRPDAAIPNDGDPRGTATAGTTAAATQGWGAPTRSDDFDAGTAQWRLYDGPGNDHDGRRSPSAVAVRDGVVTLSGDAAGITGGMCWGAGRRYGRWEARVRAPAADPAYHAVLLLWPDADTWPAGGEIDFMELADPARRTAEGFVHHGADNRTQRGTVTTDATQWHNWAVEWTPSSITMYLDGRPWYRTTDRAVQPPGPMHVCVQLDWFPTGGLPRPSTMQVDWVREYGPHGGPATSTTPAGATGTGASRAGTGG
jgi:Glycosyl hydrolases family 16